MVLSTEHHFSQMGTALVPGARVAVAEIRPAGETVTSAYAEPCRDVGLAAAVAAPCMITPREISQPHQAEPTRASGFSCTPDVVARKEWG